MGLFLPGDSRNLVVFDAEVAEKLGINAAIILSRIIWSLEMKATNNETDYFRDGRWWMYDSVPALCRYSTLGRDTVKRTIAHLRGLKIIESTQYRLASGNAENWYMVNSQKLAEVLSNPPIGAKSTSGGHRCKTNLSTGAKSTDGGVQNQPMGGAKSTDGIGAKSTDLSMSLFPKSPERQTESLSKNPATVTPLPLKPRPKREKTLKFDPEDLELANPWLEFALKESSYRNPPKGWTPEGFADGISQVRKSTQFQGQPLNHFGMQAVFKYILTSTFWRKVAWSPVGLLKKNDDGVRKIDNILRQMRPESFRQEEKIKSWAPVSEQEISNPFG